MRNARLAGALGLLLAALPACSARPAGPLGTPVAAPARLVLGEREIDALAELLRMEDERALGLPRLQALIADSQPVVRARAALAAGRIGDTAALPAMLHALADPEASVRAAAAFALGELGDSSAAVVSALAGVLAEDRAPASAEAAHALGKLPSAAAWAALAQALAAATPVDPLTRREALLAIWRQPRQPGTLALVLPWTGQADLRLRWAATYALMRVTAPAAIPRLLELLRDPDAQVRALAARGLRAGAADSAGRALEARDGLRAALADAHPHVRINAARALAAFRVATDAEALLALFQDPDGNVQLAALEALAALPASTANRALVAAIEDAGAPLALRAAAAASLARTDTAAAVRRLAAWSADPEWLPRFYAARALAATGFSQGGELLRQLARDPDPRVQGEALATLAAADTSAPLGALFLEGLAAPDPIVRAAAAGGLARRHDPAYLSALMQAYDRAQRDTLNDAALAALDGLAVLAERGAPVARAFFLRFQPSRDPVVRARVAQHFGTGEGTWGQPRPVDTGHAADFYRDRARDLVAPALAGSPPPRVLIRTARGEIVLELAAADAPLTVHNFLALIGSGFYRRAQPRWHRVVPNFVLQDGDPRGDGSGGPAWVIRDEINPLRYERGVLGMALSGPDTGGSQFFITHSAQPHLDGGYTVFGRVASGIEVADAILQDDAILAIEVLP